MHTVPGTAMYEQLKRDGMLNDVDSDKYNVYNPRQMYTHPTLSWETSEKYDRLAYRRMILLNPAFYCR